MQCKEIFVEMEEVFDLMCIILVYFFKVYWEMKSGGGDYWNN